MIIQTQQQRCYIQNNNFQGRTDNRRNNTRTKLLTGMGSVIYLSTRRGTSVAIQTRRENRQTLRSPNLHCKTKEKDKGKNKGIGKKKKCVLLVHGGDGKKSDLISQNCSDLITFMEFWVFFQGSRVIFRIAIFFMSQSWPWQGNGYN